MKKQLMISSVMNSSVINKSVLKRSFINMKTKNNKPIYANNLISFCLVILACLFLTLRVEASDIEATAKISPNISHHKMKAYGTHGMAVFSDNNILYASHMPLVNSIHAHQLLFSFTVENEYQQKLLTIIKQNALISIMPEPFDLMALMHGKLTQFTANIYVGHFERGGKVIFKNVLIKINKILLSQPIAKTNKTTKTLDTESYYLIPLEKENDKPLLMHKITTMPSFDQIIKVHLTKPQLTQPINNPRNNKGYLKELVIIKLKEHGAINAQTLSLKNFNLEFVHQYYLERQDFQ